MGEAMYEDAAYKIMALRLVRAVHAEDAEQVEAIVGGCADIVRLLLAVVAYGVAITNVLAPESPEASLTDMIGKISAELITAG